MDPLAYSVMLPDATVKVKRYAVLSKATVMVVPSRVCRCVASVYPV